MSAFRNILAAFLALACVAHGQSTNEWAIVNWRAGSAELYTNRQEVSTLSASNFIAKSSVKIGAIAATNIVNDISAPASSNDLPTAKAVIDEVSLPSRPAWGMWGISNDEIYLNHSTLFPNCGFWGVTTNGEWTLTTNYWYDLYWTTNATGEVIPKEPWK